MSTPLTMRSRPSIAATMADLRGAGKSNYGAPLYTRVVNRPLGRRFAALAHVAGLSPDSVTGISAAFTFAGILTVALVPPSPAMGVGVALLLVVGYALDAADGQLARLRGGGTLSGEWLDHVVDAAKNASIHLAVLVSLFRFGAPADPAVYLLPAAFQVVVTVMFFSNMLTDQMRGPRATGQDRIRSSLVRSLAVAPADYGLLCLAFAFFGSRPVFLVLYAFFLAGNAVYLLVGLRRWHGQLRQMDAERLSTRRMATERMDTQPIATGRIAPR